MESLLRGLFLCQVGWLNTTLRLICVLYKGNMIKLWKKNITNRYLQHHITKAHFVISNFPLFTLSIIKEGTEDLSRFIHIKFCLSVVNIKNKIGGRLKVYQTSRLLISNFVPKKPI